MVLSRGALLKENAIGKNLSEFVAVLLTKEELGIRLLPHDTENKDQWCNFAFCLGQLWSGVLVPYRTYVLRRRLPPSPSG